jgi:hypothetical protein
MKIVRNHNTNHAEAETPRSMLHYQSLMGVVLIE